MRDAARVASSPRWMRRGDRWRPTAASGRRRPRSPEWATAATGERRNADVSSRPGTHRGGTLPRVVLLLALRLLAGSTLFRPRKARRPRLAAFAPDRGHMVAVLAHRATPFSSRFASFFGRELVRRALLMSCPPAHSRHFSPALFVHPGKSPPSAFCLSQWSALLFDHLFSVALTGWGVRMRAKKSRSKRRATWPRPMKARNSRFRGLTWGRRSRGGMEVANPPAPGQWGPAGTFFQGGFSARQQEQPRRRARGQREPAGFRPGSGERAGRSGPSGTGGPGWPGFPGWSGWPGWKPRERRQRRQPWWFPFRRRPAEEEVVRRDSKRRDRAGPGLRRTTFRRSPSFFAAAWHPS